MRPLRRILKKEYVADLRSCGFVAGLRRGCLGESGAAMVEMAMVLPVALLLLTGLLSFGTYINNKLELFNATSLAGQYLAESRLITTNPCSDLSNNVQQMAPNLTASSITFNLVLAGAPSPYSGTTCAGATTYFTQGATAQITVTYPCSLGMYGVNFAPGCVFTAQMTEIVQ